MAILRTATLFALSTLSNGFQPPKLSSRKHILFAESEPSSLRKITIPQRYPDSKSPLHQNTYPSVFHTIHIASLLSEEQASKCLKIATQYAEETECWKSKDAERHVSYSTADFPIEDSDALQSYLDEIDFEKNTFNLLGELFNVEAQDLFFMDLFCAHYKGKDDGDSVMDRLALHRDGSVISFTIVLSSPEDCEGGGTEFDALKDAIGPEYKEFEDVMQDGVLKVQRPGHGVLHCGKIQHGAHIVANGERTTLTGFVEVDYRCRREGVMGEACKQWGRMDNAKNRLERQMKLVGELDECRSASSGWVLSSPKFLVGRSHVKGFAPAFSSVQRRGKFENFREKNLQAEDIVLRDILLPAEDIIDPMENIDLSQFGDITIL